MLAHLRVANLGVLADASIDPSSGFTVITGETGAGKTLLLGGLRLVLGGPSDPKTVGPYDTLARVDGLFIGEDDVEFGASRTIPAEGRSRAHLEGAIVSAAVLAERVGALVDVVGQHDQLSITRPSHVLDAIDGSLDEAGAETLRLFRESWEALQDALGRQRRLGGDGVELTRELELSRYQVAEIEGAGLVPGLDEELEGSVSRLRNTEEIREHLGETMRLVESMSETTGEMVARLRKVSGLDPSLSHLSGLVDSLAETVADLARDTRTSEDQVEADPGRLEELEGRLNALGDLKRKYGRTLDEVIAYGAATSARVSELESLLGDAEQIDTLVGNATRLVGERSGELTQARRRRADAIADEMKAHLADLGLATAQVEIELAPVDPGPSGGDRAAILFASDARLQPRSVADVASGGELSRLVLALRLAVRSGSATTLVFDEVDTGIGGKTALAMGAKLAELASGQQVLCVTHLAQVAAHADTHYAVERDAEGVAHARLLVGDDRVTELTRMLAGQPESTAGRTAAAELLESATTSPH